MTERGSAGLTEGRTPGHRFAYRRRLAGAVAFAFASAVLIYGSAIKTLRKPR
jgi:hypothetical protein